MKRLSLILLVALAGTGYAQDRGPFLAAGLTLSATQYREFSATVREWASTDPAGLADALWAIGTGGAPISGATATVTVNQAQADRWYNLAKPGAFLSRAYWALGKLAVETGRPARPVVMNNAEALAVDKIAAQAKRDRFITRLEGLKTGESY